MNRELVAGLRGTRFESTTKLLILLGQRLDRTAADGIRN